MKHFRKIWDKEKNDFLMKHREMKINNCYELFLKTFPDAQDVTITAFKNERSRIGAISDRYKNGNKNHNSRSAKPLFSEHQKKGYIRIKIGQPNEWIFKHHYVWWQNTGHKPEPKKEMVIFLDGNKNNFNFNNLFLIPRTCIAILNNKSIGLGIVPGDPEATKINALNAILIHKTFEAGKKAGLVSANGKFKEDNAKIQRERIKNLSPEKKEKLKQKRKEYIKKIYNNPEKHEEYKAKKREYYRKYRNEKSNNNNSN